MDEVGPDHQKQFTAVVKVGGQPMGTGTGRSEKAVRQEAAEAAWRKIGRVFITSSGSCASNTNGGGMDR